MSTAVSSHRRQPALGHCRLMPLPGWPQQPCGVLRAITPANRPRIVKIA